MTGVPEAFSSANLNARRLTFEDLDFVASLMARPEMNAHKPDPTPLKPDQVAKMHSADLDHWIKHGFGRYIVLLNGAPAGLCGLSTRQGLTGLNVSYHLSPDHWGCGHASALVAALVDLASTHLQHHEEIYGLVRPANPGSARVLEKSGFIRTQTLILGGAPTIRYARALGTRPA